MFFFSLLFLEARNLVVAIRDNALQTSIIVDSLLRSSALRPVIKERYSTIKKKLRNIELKPIRRFSSEGVEPIFLYNLRASQDILDLRKTI